MRNSFLLLVLSLSICFPFSPFYCLSPIYIASNPTISAPLLVWNHTYAGLGYSTVSRLIQTLDGGFAFIGITNHPEDNHWMFWLVKLDSFGFIEWNIIIPDPGREGDNYLSSICQASNGDIILCGTLFYPPPYPTDLSNIWFIRTDTSGNILINKTYKQDQISHGNNIIPTLDGGFAILGATLSSITGSYDCYLVKLDSKGNIQWNQTYGGTGRDWGEYLFQAMDGSFMLIGYTYSIHDIQEVWVIKTDSLGNTIWNQTYGGNTTAPYYPRDVVLLSDGKLAILVAAFLDDKKNDIVVLTLDDLGEVDWKELYGGILNEYGCSLISTLDGGYAFLGSTQSFGEGDYDFWLVKLNSMGFVEWSQTYGSSGADHGWDLLLTSHFELIIAGDTDLQGDDRPTAWVLKTTPIYDLATISSIKSNIPTTASSFPSITPGFTYIVLLLILCPLINRKSPKF